MSVKQRLIEFIKIKNIGQKKFAQLVGVSDGYVNAIRVSIQPDTLHKIAMRFPDLNTGWLLTGEGEMLKTEQPNSEQQDDQCDCPMHSLADSVAKIAESVTLLAKGNIELIQQQSKLIEMLYNMKTKE